MNSFYCLLISCFASTLLLANQSKNNHNDRPENMEVQNRAPERLNNREALFIKTLSTMHKQIFLDCFSMAQKQMAIDLTSTVKYIKNKEGRGSQTKTMTPDSAVEMVIKSLRQVKAVKSYPADPYRRP